MRLSVINLLLLGLGGLILAGCSSPEDKLAEYLENGYALVEEGELTKASLEFRNALQINANEVNALYGLALIFEKQQEWRKMLGVLNKIQELNPGYLEARIKLGQLLLASGQLDQALLDANDLLELYPQDANVLGYMAAVQYRLDNNEKAREYAEKALGIDPQQAGSFLVKARILMSEEKHDAAIAVLDKALTIDSSNPSMHLMKIQAYKELNDADGQLAVYQEVISKFPDNSGFYFSLADLYIRLDRIDEADAVYTSLIERKPGNTDVKLEYIKFVNKHRDQQAVVDLLERYISEADENYSLSFLLANLYEQRGIFDKAEAIYQKIIADEGDNLSAMDAKNKLALLELKKGNKEKATEINQEILNFDENNHDAMVMKAGFMIEDRQHEDAIILLRGALRDKQDSIQALIMTAYSYEAIGSSELALENFIKAFRINPSVPLVANALADVYFRKSDFSRADEVLTLSLSGGNKSLDSLKRLADVKIRLQEWEAAENIAQLLQSIEGQEALSQEILGVIHGVKKEHAESIDAFKKAYQLSTGEVRPMVSLVRAFVSSGEVDKARDFLGDVLKENDKNAVALLLLGQIDLLQKNPDSAIDSFNAAVKANPGLVGAYQGLIRLYVSRNQIGEAEDLLKSGLEKFPGNVYFNVSLASIYERKREFDSAINTYEKLLKINPDLVIVKNNLASLLTDHRGDRESLESARVLSEDLRNARLPSFRDTYAWVRIKSDASIDEAISILQGVVKEADQEPVFKYHLAQAYLKKGEQAKAKNELQKALSQAGEEASFSQQARELLEEIQ